MYSLELMLHIGLNPIPAPLAKHIDNLDAYAFNRDTA